jgi:predicted fused transcriptional regulator/phosphomethylpyrimidine kinase/predicted transcriptional regulator
MRPPCIVVVEDMLPEVRRSLARELSEKGASQESISSILGVSQAMVSRYLREGGDTQPSIGSFVGNLVRPLSAYAQQGAGREEMTRMFCSLCRHLISSGALDDRYAERFPGSPPPRCFSGSTYDERGEAIADLSAAVRYLGRVPLPDLVPAVKVNMARCLEAASSRDDVASFPGRLQDVMGTIRQVMPPQFGVSHHLADMLLEAHGSDRSVTAVANIRLSEPILRSLQMSGIAFAPLRRADGRIEGIGEGIGRGSRALADPGDFGIEPCLYIFGGSSLEVASRIVELGISMKKE